MGGYDPDQRLVARSSFRTNLLQKGIEIGADKFDCAISVTQPSHGKLEQVSLVYAKQTGCLRR